MYTKQIRQGDSLFTATWGEALVKVLLNNLPMYFMLFLNWMYSSLPNSHTNCIIQA